jgi:ABC-2 type transport system permease protein
MKTFLGIFCCEYRMSIRRRSLWLTFGLLIAFYLTSLLLPPDTFDTLPTGQEIWPFAATYAFMLNLFMPVVGGILAADRLVRDNKIGVDELLRSTAIKRGTFLAGKYLGVLASITTPVLLTSLMMGIITAAAGAPLTIIPAMLLAFLGINLPAYVLIIAFSLACPLVMPVRVYQVLFTGYWFWGNYLSPTVMPTTNGTYLSANGEYVMNAFFSGFYGIGGPMSQPAATPVDALINLLALTTLAALALLTANQVQATRAARA